MREEGREREGQGGQIPSTEMDSCPYSSALHPTEILKTAVDYFHREICRDALRSPNS